MCKTGTERLRLYLYETHNKDPEKGCRFLRAWAALESDLSGDRRSLAWVTD